MATSAGMASVGMVRYRVVRPTPVRGFTALAPQRIHFRKGVVADGGALWFGVLADIAITPRKRWSVLTRSESSDEQITVSSDCVNWLTLQKNESFTSTTSKNRKLV